MKTGSNAAAELLLLHDGELDDIRSIALGAGAGCTELRSDSAAPNTQRRFRVVVGPGSRIASCSLAAVRRAEVRVAVLDRKSDSKTLRAMLKRASVDFLIFRPVHPTALRLLITRLLYQGPERRRTSRVAIGGTVSYRSGLWRRNALLADFSLQGCNLIAQRSAKLGSKITLWIPGEITHGKPLTLTGVVARIGPAGDHHAGAESIGIRFPTLGKNELAELRQLTERYREGPAAWAGRKPATPSEAPNRADSKTAESDPVAARTPETRERRSSDEVAYADPTEPLAPRKAPGAAREADAETLLGEVVAPLAGETGSNPERRYDPRREYSRRVISRSDSKPCVLIGRDLSLGGLRVEATDRLELGLAIQVAIYARAGEVPLVLSARVDRDDGEDGLALRFDGLSGNQEAYLHELLASMPVLSSIVGDDEPIVLCEVTAA